LGLRQGDQEGSSAGERWGEGMETGEKQEGERKTPSYGMVILNPVLDYNGIDCLLHAG